MRYLLLLLTAAAFFTGCQNKENPQKPSDVVDSVQIVLNEYNFEDTSLERIDGNIGRNSTLSDLLLPFNISNDSIFTIARTSKPVFNIRKMRYGNKYSAFLSEDSVKSLNYLVYEKDPVNFVVFDLRDSLNIYTGQKKVDVYQKEFAGTIEYSLYQTLSDAGVDINLALKLSEIYAWQIDFWAIQRGDYFKVLYEQEYIGDQPVGIRNISAALFNHRNGDYYAFQFEEGDNVDYFDEDGNSLRKAFLKAPLKFSRISSRYSNSRMHPILKRVRPHHGIDYAAPRGTPVSAVGDGIVVHKKYSGGAGNFIKIKHNGTYTSGYMHLSKFASGLRVGSKVRQGDVIGYVGSTGLSTGPHLDFRFYVNGNAVNYLTMEFPPSNPIDDQHRNKFELLVAEKKQRLDAIEAKEPADEMLVQGSEKESANSHS